MTARAVVLAANAIETPKILLMSGGPWVSANRSGQVGQNLMDHPIALSYGLSAQDEPVYPQRGPLSTAGIESTRESASARPEVRLPGGDRQRRLAVPDR